MSDTVNRADVLALCGLIKSNADAAALEAAIRAQPAATGWQDIATAPRDGTGVLLWVPTMAKQYLAWWHRGRWNWSADDVLARTDTPTHWQPLPGPP